MNPALFLIADTFTDSLARLTDAEQKAVKTTAFDLQMNPSGKGLSFHRLDNAKDKQFWSVRVSGDLRLIVHRSSNTLLLCYVDHHDKAYAWAERRKLETHPSTGAAQFVEIRERVQEITVPYYVSEAKPAPIEPKKALLAQVDRKTLLAYGVPEEWIADVVSSTEDTFRSTVQRSRNQRNRQQPSRGDAESAEARRNNQKVKYPNSHSLTETRREKIKSKYPTANYSRRNSQNQIPVFCLSSVPSVPP